MFMKAYIKDAHTEDVSVDADTAKAADSATASASQIVEATPAAYPHIQPMKAAFYFDSVEGFGDWRILISTRADRNLREAKRSDQKLFAIILKKIKYVT